MKRHIAIFPLLLSLFLTNCTHSGVTAEVGTVHIGPLCPVEPCSLTDIQRDALYKNYTLSLRRTDNQRVEATITGSA